MTDSPIVPMDYDAHTDTYAKFVACAIAMTLACLFILVALVGFGKGEGAVIYLVATFGMLVGFGASIYGAVSARNNWMPAIGVLVLMGLATAVFL